MPTSNDIIYPEYSLKTININNKTWEYISAGNGKIAFLMFPGGGQTAQSNYQFTDAFKSKYRVICPTIYDVDSIKEFCEAINEILVKETADKVFLYGLSIGGMMAQLYIRRNKDKVLKLIISHAPAPKSPKYFRHVIIPLRFLNLILPMVPNKVIRYMARKFSGKYQGENKRYHKEYMELLDEKEKNLLFHFANEFYEKYLTKRLLTTWIRLHFDYYYHEKFTQEDLKGWKGKILILRTDNDHLTDDGGEYTRIYPQAKVYTFHGTGHLTFQYQFEKIKEVIFDFLK